ncbi:nitrilase-related carbon-nitrogen hydrolase [Spirosoma arcticum]
MNTTVRNYVYALAVGLILYYAASLTWWGWLNKGNSPAKSVTYERVISPINRINTNDGRGNLLGIQPWMAPDDYRDGLRFREKLHTYLQTAKDSGLIVPQKTIVIFPEYLGTWLVASDEPNRVYTSQTVQDALTTLVLASPLNFWNAYRSAPDGVTDKTKYAVFAMKARQMAEAYQLAFDMLAAEFAVTIVAGSILLPDPTVQGGKLIVGKGPLYNVSAVFHPDGRLDPQLIRKVYPINDELPFVCPTSPADVPVFDTPVGNLGVLVCADSWNAPVYKTLRQKGATLLAVPSYSAGDGVWKTVWRGYSGTKTPADARADVGRITEGQAWLAYAMVGRATPEAGITKGLNVFLRGKLWDLGTDGTTLIVNGETGPKSVRRVDGAALTCLWL